MEIAIAREVGMEMEMVMVNFKQRLHPLPCSIQTLKSGADTVVCQSEISTHVLKRDTVAIMMYICICRSSLYSPFLVPYQPTPSFPQARYGTDQQPDPTLTLPNPALSLSSLSRTRGATPPHYLNRTYLVC
jgi:hypothetical protein